MNLAIGDTLSESENLNFTGVPRFAPEILQKVRPLDPLKAKHLGRALFQLAEEGAARVFKPRFGADWIVGVVGALQFDVWRIVFELSTTFLSFLSLHLYTRRAGLRQINTALLKMMDAYQASIADDHEDQPVFLARNAWHLDRAAEEYPDVTFLKTKDKHHSVRDAHGDTVHGNAREYRSKHDGHQHVEPHAYLLAKGEL